MKCRKCGHEWPEGVKFCGTCGIKIAQPGGAAAISDGTIIDKLRALLPVIGLGKFLEPSPGVFVAQKGSTHVQVRAIDVGAGQVAIRSTSTVTVGTPITPELLEFLLKENSSFVFGGFGLGPNGEVVYSHAIMASSVDPIELGASVSAVVNMADKYDDQIVHRWGGKTARQMAVGSFIAPALLRAALQQRTVAAPVDAAVRPSPSPARPAGRPATNLAEAIKVGSILEEYAFLSRQKCSCGGAFKNEAQALLEAGGKHYDRLDVRCPQCGTARSFLFDINAFFGKGM